MSKSSSTPRRMSLSMMVGYVPRKLLMTHRGVRRSPSDLHYEGRKMVVSEFPIGIIPDQIRETLSNDATQSEMDHMKQTFRGMKVILGVDRLDYIKGIPQKLLAFDALLHDHPELKGQVTLIQVAIP